MLSIEDGVLICAARALEELRQEGFFASGDWQGWQIEIADCAGQPILSFPLGDPNLEQRSSLPGLKFGISEKAIRP